jgi:transposase
MEIHQLPALTRICARVGDQPEVPVPGQNAKKGVYGGVGYKADELTSTLADTKSVKHFLAILVILVIRYIFRTVLSVCDTGRFHTRKAVQQWPAEHHHPIEMSWLPQYSPSLNLIERLRGYIKRPVFANLDDLVSTIRHGARYHTRCRSRMGFMFDPDN